jgi:formate-dependent nitrite reductase membrane component NrfD
MAESKITEWMKGYNLVSAFILALSCLFVFRAIVMDGKDGFELQANEGIPLAMVFAGYWCSEKMYSRPEKHKWVKYLILTVSFTAGIGIVINLLGAVELAPFTPSELRIVMRCGLLAMSVLLLLIFIFDFIPKKNEPKDSYADPETTPGTVALTSTPVQSSDRIVWTND